MIDKKDGDFDFVRPVEWFLLTIGGIGFIILALYAYHQRHPEFLTFLG